MGESFAQALLGFEQHSHLKVAFDGGKKVKTSEAEIQTIANLVEKRPQKLALHTVLPDALMQYRNDA
jgi:hypothetical protein